MKIARISSLFLVSVFALAICFSQAQAKTMNLKLSYHFPAVSTTAKVFGEYAKKIEEQTNGRVMIKIYPAATLNASNDAYEAVKTGIADISFTAVNAEPEAWPLNQVFILPALGVPIGKDSVAFYKEALNKVPELAQEMMDIKLLFMWNAYAETNVHTAKKLVRVPSDTKGMKLIAVGQFVHYIQGMGANPVNLSPNDFYAGLERGVAEGCLIPSAVLDIHGLTELVPYHLMLDVAAPRFQLMMNNEKWNALSSEDKDTFNKLGEWAAYEAIEKNIAFLNGVIAKMKKLEHTVTYPTPAEFKLWQEAGDGMLQNWIEKNESKGRPARDAYEKVKAIADKYRK